MSLQDNKILNFIGGKLLEPVNGDYFDNIEPATGKAYALIPDSDQQDLEQAIQAANQAFPAWRDTPAEKRAQMMNKLAELIEARLDEFVAAESKDNGKPESLAASVDIPRGAANFRAFAKMATNFSGERYQKAHSDSYVLRTPIGVVAVISPWNLPLLLFTWKMAPALAAGNCVIAKPSEVTPMTCYQR